MVHDSKADINARRQDMVILELAQLCKKLTENIIELSLKVKQLEDKN